MPTDFDSQKETHRDSQLNPSVSRAPSATSWTKESIKSLRQRLGWSQAELSRRLSCNSSEVVLWESGKATPPARFSNELLLLSKQAEACNEEVQTAPLAENICDKKALGQIEFSEIKNEIE